MFENEIKFINDFVLNKAKDLGPLFTIEKFLSTDIHPSIKKYVESEINYLIYQDRKKLIDNSLFDYSGAKISNYFSLIADEIKKTKKVSFEDVKNIILQAVSFNANYVIRPKWALSKLIFGNNKSVSLNDVQMMLDYTYYYEYLNNVFLAYITKKKIMNISPTEFELIMNKIDRELFTIHQNKLLDNALYAIADFYSIGGLNKSIVNVEAVESFLKEKNLTELLFKLKRSFPNPAKKKFDIDDVSKILYSAFPLGVPLIEDKKPEEEIAKDEHFENPLKEANDSTEEIFEESTESVEENLLNIPEEQTSDDIFEEELLNDVTDEKLDVPKINEETIDEKDIDLQDELVSDDIKETVDEVIINESNETVETNEAKQEVLNEDEKILASLTDDIENNQEDEIIILDEKEEENLLNFYDDQTEISIDDDEIKKEDVFTEKIEEEIIENDTEFKIDELPSDVNEIGVEPEETNSDDENKIEIEHESKNVNALEDNDEKSLSDEKIEQDNHVINKEKFEDMFSFLSRKEIDRIIKNVFNSDSEDFANTVEKMSACNSVDEATEILDNIIKYARIKPHSRDAASLTKAVNKYFSQAN
ncbi:MAG: hypothetical protein WAV89_02850 [Ignavibacteriaceae bacterium]